MVLTLYLEKEVIRKQKKIYEETSSAKNEAEERK